MLNKFFCFIGWHHWTWKFERGTTLVLDAPPPPHARCVHCDRVYMNHETENVNNG